MESPLISVIVPIYNVSKYLDRCIESIINQSYKNLEIILVNDGSTDDSLQICEYYKKKDNRIIVLNKKNGGLSDARNYGIDIAKGKYIGFVDSDDLINIDMYNILYNAITKENVDIAICRYKRFNSDKENCIIDASKKKKRNIKFNYVTNEYALSKCLNTKKFTVSAWSKLYKRELFNNLKFPVGTEMEDWAIIVDLMLNCKKVALVNEKLYYYFSRSNSIINDKFKISDLKLEKIFMRNLELVDKSFPSLHNQAKTNLTANYFYVIDKMIKSDVVDSFEKEFESIVLKLKNEFFFIIFKSGHRLIRKAFYFVLFLRKKFYKKLIKIF